VKNFFDARTPRVVVTKNMKRSQRTARLYEEAMRLLGSGMTVMQVATRLGLSKQLVSGWKRWRSMPTSCCIDCGVRFNDDAGPNRKRCNPCGRERNLQMVRDWCRDHRCKNTVDAIPNALTGSTQNV